MPGIQTTYWCGTYHGTQDQCEEFIDQLKVNTCISDVDKPFIYCRGQIETTQAEGFHVQFLVNCRSRRTLTWMKKNINGRCHWEPIINFDAMFNYVWKEDTKVPLSEFEKGKYRSAGRPSKSEESQRQTEMIRDKLFEDGRNYIHEYGEHAYIIFALEEDRRHSRIYKDVIMEYNVLRESKRFVSKGRDVADFFDNLFTWQKCLRTLLEQDPDPRSIIWVFEPRGNSGKTTFMNNWKLAHSDITAIIANGKKADMKHSASKTPNRRYIFIDLARSMEGEVKDEVHDRDRVNFEAIEELKSGSFDTSKYDSHYSAGDLCHIVLFANWLPDFTRISHDRWIVGSISENKKDAQWFKFPQDYEGYGNKKDRQELFDEMEIFNVQP